MDDNFSFFYVTKNISQLTFNGQAIRKTIIIGEGHIIHQGRLMCRERMEILKNKEQGDGTKIAKKRISGVKLCDDCQKAYKRSFDSAWVSWTQGVAITGGKTPNMVEMMKNE